MIAEDARTSLLRRLLDSQELAFLMESHSGLSARIAAEAGFQGLWASGLSISAALGVRDANEASWTQVLDVVEFICDATEVPVLMDADSGFGNFNNVRRLVRKAEQVGVAGICLEDKLFPKANSFLDSESQKLATVGEFSGKIRAAKDSQSDPDFVVVARTEALVVGGSMEEALRRAEAYQLAGADAILIHSKSDSATEVLDFARIWGLRTPLVVVPTTYSQVSAAELHRAGVSLVIWANHLMRATVATMQRMAARINQDQAVWPIEQDIAPLAEVFRLQDVEELKEAERRYLPHSHDHPPRPRVLVGTSG